MDGLSIQVAGTKYNPEISNKLLSSGVDVGATAVRIGDNYEKTFLKMLSPQFEISIFNKNISPRQFGLFSTRQDIKDLRQSVHALKDSILRPLTNQLASIEARLDRKDESRIHQGVYNLKVALSAADDSPDFRKYLQKAEKNFFKAKLNPPDFEQGIYAQFALAAVQRLLNRDQDARQEYFGALASLTGSLPILKKLGEKSLLDEKSKQAFIADLLEVQRYGNISTVGKKNLFLVDYEVLNSNQLKNNYLQSRVDGKDLSGVY